MEYILGLVLGIVVVYLAITLFSSIKKGNNQVNSYWDNQKEYGDWRNDDE